MAEENQIEKEFDLVLKKGSDLWGRGKERRMNEGKFAWTERKQNDVFLEEVSLGG